MDDTGRVYDGFISYSHAADGLLAPRLQSALQRFAKPWWKRRAVRIFRDESSLSANPHLWSSITEALDTSGWFVLLLSPDAAQSEWVNQEIAYWVEHRDPGKILPVVTDGTFGWANGAATGDAVPDALRGVFSEEPRWVDVRWAKDEDQLDLQHPEFNSAIADIASTIRGIPKDELASEEVRQHRRTVRTAWTAGVALLVLGIAATIGAIVAVDRSNEAQRLAAAESEARSDADANAALARARELAASAISLLDEDPELSILLTLEAINETPSGLDQPPEVIDALWTAVQEDRLVRVVETGYHDGTFVALSPDDSTLFVVNGFPAASGVPDVLALQAYSTSDFERLWEYRADVAEFGENGVPDGDRLFLFLHVSPDGDRVSLGLRGVPARFVVLSASDGEILHNVTYPDCAFPVPWGWSPDGTVFAVTGSCPQNDGSIEAWTEILDGDTFAPLSRTASAPFDGLSFDRSGRLLAFSADEETTVFSPPDYQESTTLQGVRGIGDVSKDGSVVVTIESPADPCQLGLGLNRRPDCGTLASFSTSTGERIDLFTPLPALPPIEGMLFGFSGADRLFAVPTQGAKTLVWDIATGEQIAALPSGEGVNTAMSSDGRRAYIGGVSGNVMVFDLSPNVGLDGIDDLRNYSAIGVNTITSGQTLGAFVATDPGSFTSQIFFFDLATGALVGEPVSGQQPIVPLADDRFLITDPYVGAPLNPYAGSVTPYSWSVYDPMTGDRSRIAGCDLDLGTGLCPGGQPPVPYFWAASLDGSELARFFPFGPFTLVDPNSGEPIGELTPDGSFVFVGAFTDDWIAGASQTAFVMTDRETGETLVSIETGDRRFEGDAETLVFVAPKSILLVDFETREQSEFPIELGRVQGIAVDTGLRRIALGDENGVHVFGFDGQELASVPVPRVADLHWIAEDHVLVGTQTGAWATISLLDEDLIASATAGLTRGFTNTECSTYRIDPCSTLEEIRSR